MWSVHVGRPHIEHVVAVGWAQTWHRSGIAVASTG